LFAFNNRKLFRILSVMRRLSYHCSLKRPVFSSSTPDSLKRRQPRISRKSTCHSHPFRIVGESGSVRHVDRTGFESCRQTSTNAISCHVDFLNLILVLTYFFLLNVTSLTPEYQNFPRYHHAPLKPLPLKFEIVYISDTQRRNSRAKHKTLNFPQIARFILYVPR
jgi:hypothetical protein